MSARLGIIVCIAIALAGCADTFITSPTPTAATTDPNTFTNQVLPGGSASRELLLTAAGQISATLTSTTPAGMVLGVGIGIPRANNQCALSSAITTAAGVSARIAMAADAGLYCVKVYDSGTLTAPLDFTVSITRP
jgi:hypothetical protein